MQNCSFIYTFATVNFNQNLTDMKKAILLLCALTASLYVGAQTGAKFFEGEGMTSVSRISPNGKYAVGSSLESQEWGLDAATGFKSFIWDLETEAIEWKTSLEETDYTKSGHFADINDEKVICGWFKDPKHTIAITDWGMSYTLPLNTAAIWKDGEITSLGFGDYDTSQFNNFADGGFATAISNDSRVVVGFIASGNMAYSTPCAWIKNETTGEYEYVEYKMPATANFGEIKDVSDDGSIAVGYIKTVDAISGLKFLACYWTSPDECIVIDDPSVPIPSGCAYAVSSNGDYIAFTFDGYEPAIYLTREDRYVKCGRFEEASGLEIGAVSDNGDIFGAYKYGSFLGGDMSNQPFWYSYSNNVVTDFSYFLSLWASGLDMPYDFNYESKENVSLMSVSAGGDIFVGNGGYTPFAIITEAVNIALPPTVADLKAKVSALGEITVTAQLADAPEQYKAKSVVIYRDGEKIASIPVESGNTITYTDKNVPAGERYYTASVVYTDTENGGKEIESPRSETLRIQMEATFEFPFYDNFDSGSLSTNYWTTVKDYGETDYQSWGSAIYLGLKSTCALNTTVALYEPYSYSIVSRNIDATESETVYASFARV